MRDVVINVLALVGLALVAGGLGLMWLPLGIVAAGLELLLVAAALARLSGRDPAPNEDGR